MEKIKKTKDETKTVTYSGLLERGWTKKLIETYYPEPYATKRNPKYVTSPPMKLYSLEVVGEIERDENFKKYFNTVQKNKENRKIGAQKALKTKKQNTMLLIEEMEIEVIKLSANSVLHQAIESYNDFNFEKGRMNYATHKSDKQFLNRITVNYIRHDLTLYDYGIHSLFNKIGKDDAFQLLNKKIYDAIMKVYPQYEEECKKQLHQKLYDEEF